MKRKNERTPSKQAEHSDVQRAPTEPMALRYNDRSLPKYVRQLLGHPAYDFRIPLGPFGHSKVTLDSP